LRKPGGFARAVATSIAEHRCASARDVGTLQLSVGRSVGETLVLDVGVQDARESGISKTVIGARVDWVFSTWALGLVSAPQ